MDEVSLGIAFVLGLLSFLSPCVLPLALVFIVNLAGASSLTGEMSRRRVTFHAISFVAGFSLVFAGVGAPAGLIREAIPLNIRNLIGGSLLVVFGLWLLAARRIPWLNYEMRLNRSFGHSSGYLRSLGLGAAFALAWTPCLGPLYASVWALASAAETAWHGVYVIFAYSLGLGLPFVAIGLAMGSAAPVISWLSRRANMISFVSGILLIAVGVGLLTGFLTRLISLTL